MSSSRQQGDKMPAAGRRAIKGEATRRALMQAGFQLFAEKGYARAQISDIARAAGKSSGVFYLYFQNKEELLDAWIDACDNAVPWYYADTSLLMEKARGFILQSYWRLYAEFGPIIEAMEHAAPVSELIRTRCEAIKAKGHEALARMIRNAQGQGRSLGVDPDLTATALAALISASAAFWFKHRAALEARGCDEAAALANLDTLFSRLLGGADAAAMEAPRIGEDKRGAGG